MTSTLRGVGGYGKIEMLSDVGGWGVSGVFWTFNLYFFIKENWICAITRYHDEPNNILVTRNIPFESDVRQWSDPLMIPLHCLWAKLNNTMRGQFNVTLLGFVYVLILFVRSYARWVCSSIVCLRFQVIQWKTCWLQNKY